MYAITEKERNINGTIITTFSRDIFNANVLEVEAGTNGYKGGDSGHGSRCRCGPAREESGHAHRQQRNGFQSGRSRPF